ncbi:MAG: MBL fold metallo-hydrolase [Actinobacteria bacterium]|nr:MBL fold metallo-hydrolase [Actinomycetota bacterium]MCG2818944.1 MBL fold metallo-hydrolase [Actinomycetes bacterium]MBU4219504.1 MBL fold metallo-hydrolase [Actinomycetota bacterium]MBU4359136.1 MBL fold metallo-hydrolase [Actinomycetota bacterium]MBU4392713.1 MBL fold metallo-hydrolase [Actinomycetota bacterium]
MATLEERPDVGEARHHSRPITVGGLRVWTAVTSRFRLDGGSMFGVVPRELWEKKTTPDKRNRIRLNTNSLVIETGGRIVLVETGMGRKYADRLRDIYCLGDEGAIGALEGLGFGPEDIDTVILTHLHLDHAGGSTERDGERVVAAFPRARFIIQKEEWDSAVDPHPLARASYSRPDFMPLYESGQVELVTGEEEVAPGVWVEHTGGHTRGHQVVHLNSGGEEAVYPGDLVPTSAHLKVNWLMAWDMYPEVTCERKKRLLETAARRGTLVLFTHDPHLAAAGVVEERAGVFGVDKERSVNAES